MKLSIDSGIMYSNGLMFCRVEAGNGGTSIPLGVSEVDVCTATVHGSVPMPYSEEHGWIGGLAGCDIVVGRITGRNGLIPCLDTQKRLVSLCERTLDRGERVTLEVQA